MRRDWCLKYFTLTLIVELQAVTASQPYTLPKLGFPYEALEGKFVGAETMHLHHDKHHAVYVAKLNEAIQNGGISDAPADVSKLLANLGQVPKGVRMMVRNHGGGHFNHMLFWQWLRPQPGDAAQPQPTGSLAAKITEDFGSLEALQKEFSTQAFLHFGSGWAWLISAPDGKLRVCTTSNQDNPVMDERAVNLEGCHGYPLFGLDVWEHAYYLDHKNLRPNYIKAFWTVLNWEEVEQRYIGRQKSTAAGSLSPDGSSSVRSRGSMMSTFWLQTTGVVFALVINWQF